MTTPIRGIEQQHELNPQLLIRDTRTVWQRAWDFLQNPRYVAVVLLSLMVVTFLLPGISDAVFVTGLVCFLITYFRKEKLPFRLPKRSALLDYNDTLPGSKKPQQARGICFFGNDRFSREELWFNNDDMRTHVLIFGSTGSGKTEALISLAYNSLLQGSGFIYVDGKGDNTLFAKIFSMARQMGREDDLLLINFMTGARDIVGPQERRLSNTMNPFAMGSSSMLSQLVVSLMGDSSASPDGDMWKGRAISFVESLMKVLVYMRDQGHILLDANTVRNYFHLDRLEKMVMDKEFVRDGQESVSLEDAPPTILEPLLNYILNLPGYNKEKKGNQVSQVWEQHGFITMQLTRVFSSLADTYGHIIRTNLAEVDFKDVVLNRRILVVLLPALEKSPDELANLGKVIIASLKAMMAAGLGEEVEGEYRDVILRKPTNSLTPFLCILDEYGYYAVKGFAVVPAQARSLGFSAIFAGQDLPAFQKASKEEAASIGANTNIKICMKLEDPAETWEFFSKTAGETYITKVDAFQTKPESVINDYLDTRSASSERRARIDLMDLKDQREGEAHIFFKSRIIRARMFYANPTPAAKIQLNQFLKVDVPSDQVLLELEDNISRFRDFLDIGQIPEIEPPYSEELNTLIEHLNEHLEQEPIQRALQALMAVHTQTEDTFAAEESDEEELSEDELNIFMPLRLQTISRDELLVDDLDTFSEPILSRGVTQQHIALIERYFGKDNYYASEVAAELIKDMQQATYYPPAIQDDMSVEEITSSIEALLDKIHSYSDEQAFSLDDDLFNFDDDDD